MGKRKAAPEAETTETALEENVVEVLSTGRRQLPHKLTDTELLEFGELIAAKLDERAQQEATAQQTKSALKAAENALDAEIGRVRNILRNKQEIREVEVETIADLSRRQAITRRLDTGAELDVRPLTTEELDKLLQRNLFEDDETRVFACPDCEAVTEAKGEAANKLDGSRCGRPLPGGGKCKGVIAEVERD